jgi:SAM-dependent methyltransferase
MDNLKGYAATSLETNALDAEQSSMVREIQRFEGNCVRKISKPSQSNSPTLDVDRLSSVEWDFSQSNPGALEGIHPYPAKFIPEIPNTLMDVLPLPPGTAILDPFCGSGTTLVQAQARGIPSIGVDLNPIAVMISRVKTSPVAPGLGRCLSEVLEQALNDRSPNIPPIPRLAHWFEQPVQKALAALVAAISRAPAASREILQLAVSSIIVRVSKQESDTRYAAIEKNLCSDDVFRLFVRAAKKIVAALEERYYDLVPATVLQTDILRLRPDVLDAPIGMVITSPPYPNAYEYWLYHKYRMWWLGFNPIAVRESEIGARAHFFGGKRHSAAEFSSQIKSILKLIMHVLVPGGYCCFVVGRSRIHGRFVENAEIVADVSSDLGFEHVFSTIRNIPISRKSFNLSHANIKTETVLVFRRRT